MEEKICQENVRFVEKAPASATMSATRTTRPVQYGIPIFKKSRPSETAAFPLSRFAPAVSVRATLPRHFNPTHSPLVREEALKPPLIRGGLEGFGARKQDLRGTRILLSNQPVEEILLIQPALIQWDNRCDLHRLQLPADLM